MKNKVFVGLTLVLATLLFSFSIKPTSRPDAPGSVQMSAHFDDEVSTPLMAFVYADEKADTNITRWGASSTTNVPTNRDNTFQHFTSRYFTPTDATGSDTVNLYPKAFNTVIQYTAVDSLAFNVSNVGQSYIGDQITFLVLNGSGSGHQVKFIGTNWQFGSGGAAIALTSAKRATITFMFDGLFWFEQSRTAQ